MVLAIKLLDGGKGLHIGKRCHTARGNHGNAALFREFARGFQVDAGEHAVARDIEDFYFVHRRQLPNK